TPSAPGGQLSAEPSAKPAAEPSALSPQPYVDLAHLPQDPAVYKMLCEADTIGVFQVESRAQMATLPRLKPTQFYDLVVEVAIIPSIASFALYGFPESHAASFALLAYASAYLKLHYPAAFYTALLNNQPMGFYHPSTLVKDAQRRGVRFHPIDVQISDWDCTVE